MFVTAMRLTAVALLVLLVSESRAQEDVVYRRNGIVDRGTIVARDASGIRMLRTDSNREYLIPADQIDRMQVKLTGAHEEGDKLWDERQFRVAAEKFEEALKVESRGWLRARIASSLVACHVAAGDPIAAVEAFFKAGQGSEGEVSLSSVPLWWLPEPSPRVGVDYAGRLLRSNNPLEQVIGASFLFGTHEADSGHEVLAKLTTYRDPRIAQLARAQLWRWAAATAKADAVADWQQQVTRLPPNARAGPYFTIGLALIQLDQHEDAARAFLWPALIYRNDPKLSCRALLLAAQSLERAGLIAEAKQLYAELTVRFASDPEAATAQARLDALKE